MKNHKEQIQLRLLHHSNFLESSLHVPLELFVSGVEAQRFQCSICLDVAIEPVYHSKQDEVCSVFLFVFLKLFLFIFIFDVNFLFVVI